MLMRKERRKSKILTIDNPLAIEIPGRKVDGLPFRIERNANVFYGWYGIVAAVNEFLGNEEAGKRTFPDTWGGVGDVGDERHGSMEEDACRDLHIGDSGEL